MIEIICIPSVVNGWVSVKIMSGSLRFSQILPYFLVGWTNSIFVVNTSVIFRHHVTQIRSKVSISSGASLQEADRYGALTLSAHKEMGNGDAP